MGNDFVGTPGAAGTTPDDVRNVIDTTLTDAQLQALIDVADRLVNNTIASAPYHSEESLQDVSLYLTAHLVSIKVKALSQQGMGDASETQRAPGVLLKQLDSSYWGQTAVSLDCSGKLAKLGQKQIALLVGGGGGDFQTFDDESY